jgi:hypothetical protein
MCNPILLHLWHLIYFSFSVKEVSDEGNRREENELAKTGEFDVSASPDAANQDSKTSTGSDGDGCDISVVATIVGEPSTAIVPEDGQTLEDGQHIGKYQKYFLIYFAICTLKCPPIHVFAAEKTTQSVPSELMFDQSGDATPDEIMEGPCATADQNADDALNKGAHPIMG